jgi:hypothetical protein
MKTIRVLKGTSGVLIVAISTNAWSKASDSAVPTQASVVQATHGSAKADGKENRDKC